MATPFTRPIPTAEAAPSIIQNQQPPSLGDCTVFPADNVWNAPVDDLPVHPNSDAFINTIGADETLHPDFGAGEWPPGSGAPIGIPYATVDEEQPGVSVTFDYADESDPGPYPIPTDAPIEGGPDSDGDRHVLHCRRETTARSTSFSTPSRRLAPKMTARGRRAPAQSLICAATRLRPETWTSADAAGLPILPGLARYDEVASGEINHALRFTVPETRRDYVWPARHFASNLTDARYPPMGQRFRLRSDFDVSGFSARGAGDSARHAAATASFWPTTARPGTSAACRTSAGTTRCWVS